MNPLRFLRNVACAGAVIWLGTITFVTIGCSTGSAMAGIVFGTVPGAALLAMAIDP